MGERRNEHAKRPPLRGRAALAVAAVVAVIGAGAAGCGYTTVDAADLESSLAAQIAPQGGMTANDVEVHCPADEKVEQGNEFECTLSPPNGNEVIVAVTLTDDEGHYEATVPESQFG